MRTLFVAIVLFFSLTQTRQLTIEELNNFKIETPKEMKYNKSLPFTVLVANLQDLLGYEITLEMSASLRRAGVNDIKFGAYFPYCSNLFNMYLDLTNWTSIGKKFTRELSIEFPKLCVSDFGVSIPFTQLCFNIDDIILMPKGVQGSLRSDISIGVSNFQYISNNLTFYTFNIGSSLKFHNF
jgi:hypothetical protein